MWKWWTAAGSAAFLLILIIWGVIWHQRSSELADLAKARLDKLIAKVALQDGDSKITYDRISGSGFLFAHGVVIEGLSITVKADNATYQLASDSVELDIIDDGQPGYELKIPEHATATKTDSHGKRHWNLTLTGVPELHVYSLSETDSALTSYRMTFTRRIAITTEEDGDKHNFVYTPRMDKSPPRVAIPMVPSYYVLDAFKVWE